MKESEKKKTKGDLLKSVELLRELLNEQRLALLYLKFDVECCGRERDFWKKKAGGK